MIHYRVIGEYTKGVHPVQTRLMVQALARPEWLVEIDVTAVIPDGGASMTVSVRTGLPGASYASAQVFARERAALLETGMFGVAVSSSSPAVATSSKPLQSEHCQNFTFDNIYQID